eukprot:gene228-278_t
MYNNRFLLVALSLLFFVGSSLAAQWSVNKHYYEVKAVPATTWAAALTAATNFASPSGAPAGYKSYAAHINSKEEYDWIMTNINPPVGTYLGMERVGMDSWGLTLGGSENQEVFYYHQRGQCLGFCNWKYNAPTPQQANSVLVSTGGLWDTNWYSQGSFLIEWAPSNEPYVPATPTTGGLIVIQRNGWPVNTATLTVTITPDGSSSAQTCTSPVVTATTITCTMPAGSGLATVTIKDNTNTWSTPANTYRYQTPYVQLVYPGTKSGDVMTLAGANFGVLSSDLTIKVGSAATTCTNPTIIDNHAGITCIMPAAVTPSAPLFPISVQVGAKGLAYSTVKMAMYDKENIRAIRIFGGTGSIKQVKDQLTEASPLYPLNGNYPYLGIPFNKAQITFMSTMYPTSQYAIEMFVSLLGTGSTANIYVFGLGPRGWDNTPAVSSTRACLGIYCPTGSFVPSLALNAKYFYSFASDTYTPISAGEMDFKSELAYHGARPTINVTTTMLFPTSGGVANFQFADQSFGFRYTNRSLSLNGIFVPSTFTVNPAAATVSATIPAGTGGAKPSIVYFEALAVIGSPQIGYIAPAITTFVPSTTAGGLVIIKGTNLGNNAAVVIVSIGGKTCTSPAILTPHTEITCTIEPGAGGGQGMFVKVDQQQSNTMPYNYAPPTITAITMNEDGTMLTVEGLSFGTSMLAISLTVGTVTLPATTLIGSTFTVAIPATGTLLNGGITATVSGLTSAPFLYSFTPLISSVLTVPPTSGGYITIAGRFLNTKRINNTNTVITVTAKGAPCTSPTAFTDSSLNTFVSCSAPAGTGLANVVVVTFDGQSSKPLSNLNYASPTISSFSQSTTLLSLVGSNFGNDASVVSVSFNGGQAVPVTIVNNHIIVSTTAPDGTLNGDLTITVNSQTSPVFDFFLIPSIVSATPIPTRGGEVIITGSYFNTADINGDALSASVQIGGQDCTPFTIQSSTQITCTGPAGTGVTTVSVTIDGKVGEATYTYIAPVIKSTTGVQSTLSISGDGFGLDKSLISITFPNTEGLTVAADLVTDDLTQVIVINTIPNNVLNGALYITVDGLQSLPVDFAVTPSVSIAIPTATAGGLTTITGSHFTKLRANMSYTNVQVTIGGVGCDAPNVISLTSLSCLSPPGTGISNILIVTIDGASSDPATFAYNVPTLTDAVQDGQTMILTGTQFGTNTEVVFGNFGTLVSPKATEATDTEVRVTIPTFAKSGDLTILVDSQLSNSVEYTLAPILNSVSTIGTEGGVIYIDGLFLNDQTQGGSTVSITALFVASNQPCTELKKEADHADYSTISCKAPAGSGNNLEIQVTVGGKTASILFSYGAPVISSIEVSSSNMITISGQSFGTDESKVSVAFGSLNIVDFTLASQDTIEFQAPENAINALITVTVESRTSNAVSAELFPILSTVSNSDTYGSLITITGSYLNGFKSGNVETIVHVDVNGKPCFEVTMSTTNNTLMTCTAPRGTGSNLVLTLTIESRQDTLVFAYNAPVITSNTQDGTRVVFIGNNFGNRISTLTLSPEFGLVSITDERITATLLPSSDKNGPVIATVSGQSSAPFTLNIVPSITAVSSASPYGGSVTVSGTFLNQERANGQDTTITIDVDGSICTIHQGPNFVCTLPKGSYNEALLTLTIDGASGTGSYSSLAPLITSATSVYYLIGGDITIAGDDFIEPLQVNISSSICSSPVLLTPQSIKCTYEGSDAQPASGLPVTILAGTRQSTATVFNYTVDSCPNDCTANGLCSSGLCLCNSGFSGSKCDIVVVDPIATLPTDPSTTFTTSNISFNALIHKIVEVNVANTVVKEVDIASLTWIPLGAPVEDEVSTTTKYTSTFALNTFQLTVSVSQFNDSSIVDFGGQSIPNAPSSIKHTVTLSNWGFSSPANSLLVIYRASFPTHTSFDCGNTTSAVSSVNTPSGDIKSLTVDTPYGVFVASFSNRLIADDVWSIMPITIAEQTTTDDVNSHVDIALHLPIFENQVTYDPTFIAHTKSITQRTGDQCPSAEGPSGKKSNRSWVIPVAVILSILGAALIGVGIYFIIKKKNQNSGGVRMK